MEALLAKVMELLAKPEVIAVAAFCIEMAMRLIKTDKPWSLMHAAKRIIRAVALACGGVADFMDKILPQNVAPPAELPKQ